jgi:dephospho-CoA kinase
MQGPTPLYVLGLTGSIGMGKSTTAAMFAEAGVPVHDADATVHRLYAGAAVAPIAALFPNAVRDGVVDRAALGQHVLNDPAAMTRLEAVIHPLVRAEEERFLADARAQGHRLVVLDIPLLFETGAEARCDGVLVVTAPAEVQRARVLARPGMTAARFEAILARQLPDAEKRARADFVVDTSRGLADARAQVATVLARLKQSAAPNGEPPP